MTFQRAIWRVWITDFHLYPKGTHPGEPGPALWMGENWEDWENLYVAVADEMKP